MAKYNWTPVEEMDLDDGTHTCYATKSSLDGRLIWLTQIWDNTWDVELQNRACAEGDYTTIANCKTLTSAKRYAARYL